MDPLAVLMSRVWTSPIDETALDLELKAVMKAAATVDLRSHSLHWHDEETRAFVKFWFDGPQRRALTRLAYVIDRRRRRRSEEHTSELQSLMSNSYAVFCWTKEKQ